jgi:hypothetical protein
MYRKLAIGSGLTGLVLAAGIIASLPAGATNRHPSSRPTTAATCPVLDDAWPDWVNGRPAGFDVGDNGGVYLWHDAAGFHLRVTHKTHGTAVFTGSLSTRGVFADVGGVALEQDDHVTVGADDHLIGFRFVNHGHIDGLDFHTRCAPALTMTFRADGHTLPADRIIVGHFDRHPGTDPFTIDRAR